MNEREDIERENEGRATWESDGDIPQYVIGLFNAFKESRRPWEELWEELWFNYLGQYQESTKWKKNEGVGNRSRVFIKLTQLKANTAHAKIIDVMFSGRSELPFDLEPYDYEGAGIAPDEAKKIAEASKRKVRDHFRKIELEEILDTAILEKTILGTGVLKSPIIDVRKRNVLSRRTIGGIPANQLDSSISPFQVKTVTEMVPVVDHVPLWEYYTDINAKSNKDAIGEIHFQRLLPEKFRQFMAIDGFDKEAVREAARRATVDGGEDDGRRVQLGDNYAGENPDKDKRVSVIEYWGLVPVRMLREAGVEVPEDEDDEGDIESLVYLAADGILLKACVNPLGYRPFKVCPYKKRPHVIYGMGPAEMMRDSQKMVNSSARLIVDNKALSGNGMVAVNMERIDKKMTKGMKVYPGKVWYVKGNYAPKDVVDSVRFNDVTKGLRELLELFVRFSDEETGIPKYTHGEQDSFLNKMLDIETPVPMADGTWKRLADIRDGDVILGSDGLPVNVKRAHEIHDPERAYKITFGSGEEIIAGGEHLWTVMSAKQKALGSSMTICTDDLFEKFKKNKTAYFIPRVQRPRFGVRRELPLDPYILGLWLGDGHSYGPRITISDEGIADHAKEWAERNGMAVTLDGTQNAGKAKTYYIGKDAAKKNGTSGRFEENGSLRSALSALGLIANKHIPEIYLTAAYEDRLSLLRGLMDTDGCHHSGALTIFTQKEGRLLGDAVRLIAGLGGFPQLKETNPGPLAKDGARYFNVHFRIFDNPFLKSCKAEKWVEPKTCRDSQRIVSIEPANIRPMRCLTVDAEDGLFCVGERFTVTHNTAHGMSMLMTQANINLKTVLRNIDNYWIEPLVEEFHGWFEEMDGGTPIPMRVRALGTDSLIAKELKMENIMKFLQITSAPQDAILTDRPKMMRDVARILETQDYVRPEEQIEGILKEMGERSAAPKDLRELVNVDKLYALLHRSEQVQILEQLGIKPDASAERVAPPAAPQAPEVGGMNASA